MALQIRKNLSWVGIKDGDLQYFHGLDYPTNEGISQNSYLIREQKNVLIDTVWTPYAEEYLEELRRTIALERIDAIVINHAEIDRSGALPALMAQIPHTPIYCTANGRDTLRGQFHQDWNFQVVKTGDSLDLGNQKQLLFLETPMLHWPDSMMSYLSGDGTLFSSDTFGQHYSSKQLFNDLVDPDILYRESMKYYANTLVPFNRVVRDKLDELLASELDIRMICPANGVVWRDHPLQIVQRYQKWAQDYQENQITLVYDSQRNSTRDMAEAIHRGLEQADSETAIKVFNLAQADQEEILTEIFRSKALLIGSPTINIGVLPRVAALLEAVSGLRFPAKQAAAFGSYGWSGEAVDKIGERLQEAGFSVAPGLQVPWRPDQEALQACEKFGRDLAKGWAWDEERLAASAAHRTHNTPTDPNSLYKCWACGWVYDPAVGIPEQGIPPGTPWEEVPEEMQCPVCFLNKKGFDPVDPDKAQELRNASQEIWD